MQTSLLSLSLYLLANFLPIFASENKVVKKILDWSFIGANSKYFAELADYQLTDQTLYALIGWIIFANIAVYFAYKHNGKIV